MVADYRRVQAVGEHRNVQDRPTERARLLYLIFKFPSCSLVSQFHTEAEWYPVSISGTRLQPIWSPARDQTARASPSTAPSPIAP